MEACIQSRDWLCYAYFAYVALRVADMGPIQLILPTLLQQTLRQFTGHRKCKTQLSKQDDRSWTVVGSDPGANKSFFFQIYKIYHVETHLVFFWKFQLNQKMSLQ